MPSFADLIRSMGIIAVIAVLVWVFAYPHGDEHPVHTVDIGPTVHAIDRVAAYDALVPGTLSSGWRPTSASITPPENGRTAPTALHIGWVTPADRYAALEESDADSPSTFIADETDKGDLIGSKVIAGNTWQQRQSDDRHSFVRTADGVVLVVTGTASWTELAELAASLTPAPAG